MSDNLLVAIIQAISAASVPIFGASITYYYKKKSDGVGSYSRKDLKFHPIFSRLNFNKSMICAHFKLENGGKEVVFREILTRHMGIYETHLTLLCNKIDSGLITEVNELYSNSVLTLGNIINDLTNFYKYDSSFTSDEIKVLEIVIKKYSNWNYGREQQILGKIQEACGNNFYCTLQDKTVTILDTFLFAINDTVSDSSKTLDSINGDLKGLKFKGVVI